MGPVAGSQLFDLRGRTALVTGSSQGIGRAIAITLAQHGAHVVVHGVEPLDHIEKVAAEIRQLGGRCEAVSADLGQEGAPARLLQEVKERVTTLDILVLGVALNQRQPWWQVGRRDVHRMVDSNLQSSLELMQLAVPGMVERGWGRVLVIGSIQQFKPHPDMLIYAALKAALGNMARNLARQLAPRGVTVNVLAPGVILTQRNAGVLEDEAYREAVLSGIPMGRMGEPVDCAGAALLLCSEAGRYITGVELLVDGGMHLQ